MAGLPISRGGYRPGMTDVHPSAVAFGSVADEYERGRPGYPPEAVAWLAEAAGLTSSSTIVDVAAGTGKLTRLLGAVAGRVVAVEPSDGMRAYIARTARGVEVLDGTAQHLPLDAGSADLITVAQAFHWFASDEALAEFVRVLVPTGHLALVWNMRSTDQPIQAELEQIVSRHRSGEPRHRSGVWRELMTTTRRFALAEEATFPHPVEVTHDGLVDRIASTSIIASLPDAERGAALAEVRRLAEAQPEPFTLEHVTHVHLYRVS